MTREGGAQPKEYLAKYAADRVRTVSMTWLGSTMGCAECHDHKYDPFTSKDFYSMEAFFADLKQWGVYADYGYTPNPDLKGFNNDYPFPPEISLDSPYLHRRIERLSKEQNVLLASVEKGPAAKSEWKGWESQFKQWMAESESFLKQWPAGWAAPLPKVVVKLKDTNAVAKTNFTIESDAMISFKAGSREKVAISLLLSNMWVAAVRLEIVPQEENQDKRMARKKRAGTDLSPKVSLKKKDGTEHKLAFDFGDADHKEQRYSNGSQVIGVTDIWRISTEAERQKAVWLLAQPVKAEPGDVLEMDLGAAAIATARVSVTPFASTEPLASGVDEKLRKALQSGSLRAHADQALLGRAFLFSTHWDTNAIAKFRRLENEIRLCGGGKAFTMVSAAREPSVTRILARGNWQDETGEIVQPEVPHFLSQIPDSETRRLNRLDLAQWLVSPQNPLTARAVMNRLWKQFFGCGISSVVDDLGAQGEWPVHPELLDWLACEFMKPEFNAGSHQPPHAWDLKHMVRLMVMSSTYRQSSNQRPELKEIDPNNRLLACQSPRRLDAEFVRDNALDIAGLLNDEIGGPSAYPYQPAGYYANIQFPDRDYYPDKDERQYRRGVYAHWQRTFLHPMLANFDAPSREECVANRIVSNTPQQALTLLNDPTFVEAARVLAARALNSDARSDDQRVDWLFQRALARAPRDKERLSLEKFLAAQRDHYKDDAEGAAKLIHVGLAPVTGKIQTPELAVWTEVCRVVLNLHETITVY